MNRYVIVVARDRPELLGPTLQRFGGESGVLVVIDRRMRDRRSRTETVTHDRRHGERRRPPDFWADLRHHPVVLAEARVMPEEPEPGGQERLVRGAAATAPTEVGIARESRAMESRRQVEQWLRESQQVLEQVLPALLDDREALRERLRAADEEITRLRLDLERARRDADEGRQRQADASAAVRRLVAEMGALLEVLSPSG
jgi:hypothetical protein